MDFFHPEWTESLLGDRWYFYPHSVEDGTWSLIGFQNGGNLHVNLNFMWAVHEDFDVKKHLFRARVIWGSSIAVLWRAIELLGNNHRVLKTYIYIYLYIPGSWNIQNHSFIWKLLFQLDDSNSVHRKFHQTTLNWLFLSDTRYIPIYVTYAKNVYCEIYTSSILFHQEMCFNSWYLT